MKNCPFQKSDTTCGDWCQLYIQIGENGRCSFQQVIHLLGEIQNYMPEPDIMKFRK